MSASVQTAAQLQEACEWWKRCRRAVSCFTIPTNHGFFLQVHPSDSKSRRDKARSLLRDSLEHPLRYPHITALKEWHKAEAARFLRAKDEAERLFKAVRHASLDEGTQFIHSHPPSPEAILLLIHVAHRESTLEKVTAGASAKLARDPKHAVKPEIFKLWKAWQTGKIICKSGAEFARKAVERYPVIESPVTVQRWVTLWTRESRKSE